jgi:hypothetical protein
LRVALLFAIADLLQFRFLRGEGSRELFRVAAGGVPGVGEEGDGKRGEGQEDEVKLGVHAESVKAEI